VQKKKIEKHSPTQCISGACGGVFCKKTGRSRGSQMRSLVVALLALAACLPSVEWAVSAQALFPPTRQLAIDSSFTSSQCGVPGQTICQGPGTRVHPLHAGTSASAPCMQRKFAMAAMPAIVDRNPFRLRGASVSLCQDIDLCACICFLLFLFCYVCFLFRN
jgi:hypothetical protein